jgi:hypothetical protein
MWTPTSVNNVLVSNEEHFQTNSVTHGVTEGIGTILMNQLQTTNAY